MIAYDLQCSGGHRFEGWFEDSKAFEQQCRQGLIACPVCNDTDVTRIPSTFAIKGIKHAAPAIPPQRRPLSEQEIMARAVMHFVENNFDNVGTDFAKEALKIHYGASEPRNIRGVSTAQEEETLRREGVEFFKVPLPDPSESTPSSSDS
ncbi:MAG: DUF1178 family protein [Desulfobacteraceae bacterium]|nr:MAG: DUF1178 family protein [Desulfobacteraceae bacterium]